MSIFYLFLKLSLLLLNLFYNESWNSDSKFDQTSGQEIWAEAEKENPNYHNLSMNSSSSFLNSLKENLPTPATLTGSKNDVFIFIIKCKYAHNWGENTPVNIFSSHLLIGPSKFCYFPRDTEAPAAPVSII